MYKDGVHGEPDLLASCHRRSLEVAVKNGLKTVAFPAISCGVYGYPITDAARIATTTVRDFAAAAPGSLDLIRFVLFSPSVHARFAEALDALDNG